MLDGNQTPRLLTRREACRFGLGAATVVAFGGLLGCTRTGDGGSGSQGADDASQAASGGEQAPVADTWTVWEDELPSLPSAGPVDWRDRPSGAQSTKARFDVADMPEPFTIDYDLYFGYGELEPDADQMAEAQARMQAAAEESNKLEAAYEAGEITADECARKSQPYDEEYYDMRDALKHGRLDWNPCHGLSDNFTRRDISGIPSDDADAIESDAAMCIQALAEYMWRKEGLAMDAADWNVYRLHPLLYSQTEGKVIQPDSESYGDESCVYTGYFYAQLEQRSDFESEYGYEGYSWWPSYEVVFSPVGSTLHLPYGGMDNVQISDMNAAICADIGPAFPFYDVSVDSSDTGADFGNLKSGYVDLDVEYHACPAVLDKAMLSEHLDEGADWRSAVSEAAQIFVRALYVDEVEIDFDTAEQALSGAMLNEVPIAIVARIGATLGSDWNLYEGGHYERRVNAAWLASYSGE